MIPRSTNLAALTDGDELLLASLLLFWRASLPDLESVDVDIWVMISAKRRIPLRPNFAFFLRPLTSNGAQLAGQYAHSSPRVRLRRLR